MTSDQVEDSLRRAGRPEQPPDRLRRAVLGIPGDTKKPRSRRRLLIAGLSAVAAALLIISGVALRGQPSSFQASTTIQLHGSVGAAKAELGKANGPNRPVQLLVDHLVPGSQRYFELWSLSEQPPMLLTTFMTNPDGSCIVTFSAPVTVDWRDIVITPRENPNDHVLCSNGTSCS